MVGGVSVNGEFIENSWIYRNKNGVNNIEDNEIKDSNSGVIYIGYFNATWGHLITDCLKFLWFLKSEYLAQFKDYTIVYVSVTKELPRNFIKILDLLGFDIDKFVRVEEITRFNQVILPDECFYLEGSELGGSYKYTSEYTALINEIMSKITPYDNDDYDKIYFTRSKFSQKDIGERKIEEYFKNKGYRIVAPEMYSMEEQLRIYKSCNHFVATDGSISHNAVFMKDNIDAIIILRGAYVTKYQFAISELRNMKVDYIESHLSVLQSRRTPQFGPNFYYVSDYLLKYYNEKSKLMTWKYWFDNFSDFETYLGLGTELDLNGRLTDKSYYARALEQYKKYIYFREKHIINYCVRKILTKVRNKISFFCCITK